MKRKMLILIFIFWGISCFVAGWLAKVNAAESNEYVTMQSTFSYSYKWFAVTVEGKNVAYVDADCKIVELYPINKYKYLKAELKRYAGMCRDFNRLEKEIKENRNEETK